MNTCRMCGFWGDHKGAMGSLFQQAWSAQTQERIGNAKDITDYNSLYEKYPYGICKCPEFVDASSDWYKINSSEESPDFYRCPQKGVLFRDGEGCGASFVTRENFGCVYWIQRPKE